MRDPLDTLTVSSIPLRVAERVCASAVRNRKDCEARGEDGRQPCHTTFSHLIEAHRRRQRRHAIAPATAVSRSTWRRYGKLHTALFGDALHERQIVRIVAQHGHRIGDRRIDCGQTPLEDLYGPGLN